MSSYKLVIPSIEYDKEIQAYRQEFVEKGGSMDGCLNLRQLDTQSWLDKLSSIALPENLPDGWVSQTQFIYVRKSDRKVVGVIQIRHFFNERLANFGGHIGYSVCHSERKKGIAKQMLHDVMPFCLELGIEKALVTCLDDNEGSRRTILANGGVYESTVFCEEDGVNLERYWIDVPAQAFIRPDRDDLSSFVRPDRDDLSSFVRPDRDDLSSFVRPDRDDPVTEKSGEPLPLSPSPVAACPIYLRKARPDDLEKIWHNCWYSEDVERFTLRKKTESLEEARQRLADTLEFQKKNPSYFVCLTETDEPIGFAGIRLKEGCRYADNKLWNKAVLSDEKKNESCVIPSDEIKEASCRISSDDNSDDQKPVAVSALNPIDTNQSVQKPVVEYHDCGIAIGDQWQGKGYGKMVVAALEKLAFDQLCADRFVYSAMTQNQRSKNLAQSMGFVYCGSSRQVRVRDSFPYAEDSFVKTSEEYEHASAGNENDR